MSNLAYVLCPVVYCNVRVLTGWVSLQPGGVEKILPLGALSLQEVALIKEALPELKKNIEKGKQFVQDA